MTKKSCDHIIGLLDIKEYRGGILYLSDFIFSENPRILDSYDGDNINLDFFYNFEYCPDCGKETKKEMRKAYIKRKIYIDKKERERKIIQEKNDKIINDKIKSIMEKSGLNKLDPNYEYCLIFRPNEPYVGQHIVLSGTPIQIAKELLSDCIKYNLFDNLLTGEISIKRVSSEKINGSKKNELLHDK